MEELIVGNIPLEYLFYGIVVFFIVILFIMNISSRFKIKKLKQKYEGFMNGLSDRNMEEIIEAYIGKVNEVINKNREIENHINHLEREQLKCIQKIGIVRYNAFDNVGSDLSFSIALLDSNDNGVVMSGIYSRESSTSYAKPIINSNSKYALSAEEIQALDIAKKSSRERSYTDKGNI